MISKETQEIMQLLNPWWKSNSISPDLAKPLKRKKVYERIESLSKNRQVLILTGLRRVGKSTLLYQTLGEQLKKNDASRLCYFSFDRKIEKLVEVFETYSSLTAKDYKKEEVCFFLDEITKLPDWASQLKL